jgi:antitoxin (DNA-binding transcriptional repressor) of toxin-antitoxin stability system
VRVGGQVVDVSFSGDGHCVLRQVTAVFVVTSSVGPDQADASFFETAVEREGLDRVMNIDNNRTMIVVNIHEAKAKLSEYLHVAARGERVMICNRNRPVAELRAVEGARTQPRPVGLAKGQFEMPPAFFDPLPDDVLDAFEGGRPSAALLEVADGRPRDGFGSGKRRARRRA